MTRAVLVSCLALAPLPAGAADWPQWRGPNRDGHAPGAQLPRAWPDRPPAPKWTADVGSGYSGPVVARGKVFVHARDDENARERCLCRDATTGKQLWAFDYPCAFKSPDPTAGKGPNATPAVDRDRVYFFGLGGMLTCAEFDTGKILWRHDCLAEYWGVVKSADGDDAWFPPCGASASPLVDGDTVVVPVGGRKAGAVTAFDRDTGTLAWSALTDRSSYASPVVASPGGTNQFGAFTGTRMVGLRYADRELLWSVPFPARYEQTVVSPVVWKDTVVIGGEARPTLALKRTARGEKVRTEFAWISSDLRMYLTTPVVFAGHLLGFDSRTGKLVCLNLDTGELTWTSPALGTKHISLVIAGNAVFALTLEGELLVLQATPEEYIRLAKWKVSEKGTWAHPAVAGNALFVKGPDKLLCFELK